MSFDLLKVFIPEVVENFDGSWVFEAEGKVPLENWEALDFEGRLAVDDIELKLKDMPRFFDVGEIDLKLNPQEVALEKVHFSHGEGSIDFNGNIHSNGLLHWDQPNLGFGSKYT